MSDAHQAPDEVEPPPEPARCLNCDEALQGSWCHRCGQRDIDLDRAIWHLAADAVSEAFEADGRIPRTVRPFFLGPGELTRAFVEGRRSRFTSPVRLFIFCLFVSFVGFGFAADREVAAQPAEPIVVEGEDGAHTVRTDGGLNLQLQLSDEETGRSPLEGYDQQRLVREFFAAYLEVAPTAVVVLVPVLALLLELVLFRERLLSHLVLSLNLHSRALVLLAAAVLIGRWVVVAVLLLLLAYLFLALRRVYDLTWRGAAWRWLVVVGGYAVATLAAMITAAVIAVQAFAGG